MTMPKQGFKNVCKCINKFKLKYHIYKNIQTLYSVLCWSTYGSDYCLESSWVQVQNNSIWGVGFKSGIWLGHSTHSETCLEATSVLSWLCASGSLSCSKVNLRPSLRSWAGFQECRYLREPCEWVVLRRTQPDEGNHNYYFQSKGTTATGHKRHVVFKGALRPHKCLSNCEWETDEGCAACAKTK
jgi:hypothetical protein